MKLRGMMGGEQCIQTEKKQRGGGGGSGGEE